MEPAVIAAVVAAAASVVVSVVGYVSARQSASRTAETQAQLEAMKDEHARGLEDLKHSHARAQSAEERDRQAMAELDRHREPLLLATLDLAHRIRNIRTDGLLEAYLHPRDADPHRKDMTRLSTLYRFARYWCVVESLYDDVRITAFEASESTRPVAGTLRDVGRTFADDELDEGRFMMWREEQRAVAERMRPGGSGTGMLGYASFVEFYASAFQPWFENFAAALDRADAPDSVRLLALQDHLARLAEQLDRTGTFELQRRGLKER